jgi:hypothetical protein
VFRETGLDELRRQKQRLVSQSDANRRRLIADIQRLQSPDCWRDQIFGMARRHPVGITTLAVTTGLLFGKIVRRPASVLRGIGRLGRFAPMAFTAWKLLRRKNSA